MRTSTIQLLARITPEENDALEGRKSLPGVIRQHPTGEYTISSVDVVDRNQYFAIKTHPRFVHFPPHKHDYSQIMYVCGGSVEYRIDGEDVLLEKGDLIFLNQHTEHEIRPTDTGDIAVHMILLPRFYDIPLTMLGEDNLIARFIVSLLSRKDSVAGYLVFRTNGDIQVENLVENLVINSMSEENDMRINQITMGVLFIHLLKHIEYIDEASSERYEDFVKLAVMHYLERHYQNASQQELSEQLHISVSSLSRRIKKVTGQSYSELLEEIRMGKAVSLLLHTDMTVEDIHLAVGYENGSYFYRHFKKRFGMSPKGYRLLHKSK